MIDRPTIERILAAANIVDVVSDFVTLKKAGMNYKGLCPFHSDTTPSFSVSPSRNICHCFACGKGGTPVSFIMEHEQMTYPEALRWLAKKYHIEIKERELTSEEKQQESERESLFIVNEWAAKYYHDILHDDVDGRAIGMQYFRSRGFRDDIIEKFRLGFALNERQAMPREAVKKGYKPEFLVKTGLCYSRDNNSNNSPSASSDGANQSQTAGVKADLLVDRFAGRAIFPWIGLSGKVVAFGGRKLDAATKGVQQKYVNSPESPIYHKDHELYGIYQAKKAIAKEDCVYMVEGYTDVISMHQCGLENVVANSGTALSQHQIHMLHRLTKNIVLLYDGDAAGIKAAMRGTDMLLENGMNIKVLILPDGDDPDSFARKHTAEEYRKYIETHQTDFIQFKTQVLLDGVTDPVKRSEAISSIVKSVSVIPDPIVRAAYLQDCAARLGMAEKTLLARMNRFISDNIDERRKRNGNAQPPAAAPQDVAQTEGTSQPASPTEPLPPSTPKPANQQTTRQQQIERLIIESVIRNGEEIIKDDVPTEDGQTVALTLAQYVYYDLTADELMLHDELYQRILIEAVERSGLEDFHAAPYFSQHPDIDVSRFASSVLQEKYVLSESLKLKTTPERLLSQTERLLLELRREIIDSQLKDILKEIAANVNDRDKAEELMSNYKELRELSANLAKRLGKNLR